MTEGSRVHDTIPTVPIMYINNYNIIYDLTNNILITLHFDSISS